MCVIAGTFKWHGEETDCELSRCVPPNRCSHHHWTQRPLVAFLRRAACGGGLLLLTRHLG